MVVWLPNQDFYRHLPDALSTGTWTTWDGGKATFAYREHTQVLLSYGPSGYCVGNVGYAQWHVPFINVWSEWDFDRGYQVLGDMALIL